MKRKDYKNYTWYDLTDNEYWVEDLPDEFPGCITIVYHPNYGFSTQDRIWVGWGTMYKEGNWKFMIIEKP